MKCCKICYASTCKPLTLNDSDLCSFISKLFSAYGISQELTTNHNFCFECKALIRKSYTLVQKALNADKALQVVAQQQNISLNAWNNLRKQYGLISTLGYHKIYEEDNIVVCVKDDEAEIEFSYDLVKCENISNENDYTFIDVPNDAEVDTQTVNKSDNYDECSSNVDETEKDKFSDPTVIKTEPEEHDKDSNVKKKTKTLIEKESYSDPPHKNYNYSKKKKSKTDGPKKSYGKHNNTTQKTPTVQKTPIVKSSRIDISKEHILKTNRKRPKIKLEDSEDDMSKRQNKSEDESDYKPDSTSSEEDSETSSVGYNELGKLVKLPREYPRTCEKCDAEIESGKQHYIHYMTYHDEKEYPYKRERNWVCQYCGMACMSQGRLADHEKRHGKEKTFICTLCNKKFFTKNMLYNHKSRVHVDIRFFCDYCNKGFKEKASIRLHIRTHTGEKPYKCHICGAGFAHGGNVGIHIRAKHQNMGFGNTTKNENKVSRKKENKRKQMKRRKHDSDLNEDDRKSSDDDYITLDTLRKEKKNKMKYRAKTKKPKDSIEENADLALLDVEENIANNFIEKKSLKRGKRPKTSRKVNDNNESLVKSNGSEMPEETVSTETSMKKLLPKKNKSSKKSYVNSEENISTVDSMIGDT